MARFWEMLQTPPVTMPRVMPMTPIIAPECTRRHPRAAAIFDNLYMMHDIVSDILTSPRVSRDHQCGAIYAALAEFRDTTRNVMSREEWLMMGHHMGGSDAMGGAAVGLLPGGRRAEHEMPMNPHD